MWIPPGLCPTLAEVLLISLSRSPPSLRSEGEDGCRKSPEKYWDIFLLRSLSGGVCHLHVRAGGCPAPGCGRCPGWGRRSSAGPGTEAGRRRSRHPDPGPDQSGHLLATLTWDFNIDWWYAPFNIQSVVHWWWCWLWDKIFFQSPNSPFHYTSPTPWWRWPGGLNLNGVDICDLAEHPISGRSPNCSPQKTFCKQDHYGNSK